MQSYKSSKNIEIDRKLTRQEKRNGEFTFELEPNSSGTVTIPFPKEYKTIPFVYLTVMVEREFAFDVQALLTKRSLTEFSVDIQSISSKPIKGTILWHAE
jgi:hypothetical protein